MILDNPCLETRSVGHCNCGELAWAEVCGLKGLGDEAVDNAGVAVHGECGDDSSHPDRGLGVDPLRQQAS